jgi:hypothetical protein
MGTTLISLSCPSTSGSLLLGPDCRKMAALFVSPGTEDTPSSLYLSWSLIKIL